MVDVIFEDDFLLVVEKPAGLITTSSETQKEKSLEDILREEYGLKLERSGIVHRLDKDTSGLLLVAKTLDVWEKLKEQFKERTVRKQYLTLVHGWIGKPGRVEGSIIRNPGDREKFIVLQPQKPSQSNATGTFDVPSTFEAREAVTEYEPEKKFKIQNSKFKIIFEDYNKIQMRKLEKMHYGEVTLLRCFPLTGRTHQIRVHLKYINHPVVGDDKYGGRKIARLDKRWCKRQFLHAAKLEFIHPVTLKRMSFESKLPDDLKKALEMLEVIISNFKCQNSNL